MKDIPIEREKSGKSTIISLIYYTIFRMTRKITHRQ